MHTKLVSRKVAVATTAALSVFFPTTVTASNSDKIMNMSKKLTCANFLDMDMMQKVMSVVWLSGWTSKEQEKYMFAPDRNLLSNKKELLEENCQSNEQDLVLNQIPDWEY